jgi:hypothetical protein
VEPQQPLDNSHPEPLAQSGSGLLQKTAEVAAVAALLSQVAAQIRARRAGRSADELDREDAALTADRAAMAAARAGWAPARHPEWLADASLRETARAWGSALPYEHADPGAAVALDACEVRLRDLHPYAMRIYDRARSRGQSRAGAMRTAAEEFLKDPRPRPAPKDTRDLHLPLPAAAGATGQTWVLEGPDARVTSRILGIIRRYNDQAVAAGEGPLSARVIQAILVNRTNIKPSLARKIVQGLLDGDQMVPQPAPPGGARSVSGTGVAAADWPEPPRTAVAATAIRQAAGGPARTAARARPRSQPPGRAPRRHP